MERNFKLLLFGAKGWIASLFMNHFQSNHKNVEIILAQSRANDIESVKKELESVKPDNVISLIGRTHGWIQDKYIGTIDYLEYPGKLIENLNDNLMSIVVLAQLCSSMKIHFTYLGTGCIFDFDEDQHPREKEVNGFKETDNPNFYGSQYSVVKGITDQLMNLYENNTLTLRIRMPINSQLDKRNFITKIINYEKICSIANSMTVLSDVFPIIYDMMLHKKVGKYNMTNPGLITHNEILQCYKEIVNPSFTWKNFTLEEQAQVLKSNRSNNYLDTSKIEKEYPYFKNIKDSIRDVMIKIKQDSNQ